MVSLILLGIIPQSIPVFHDLVPVSHRTHRVVPSHNREKKSSNHHIHLRKGAVVVGMLDLDNLAPDSLDLDILGRGTHPGEAHKGQAEEGRLGILLEVAPTVPAVGLGRMVVAGIPGHHTVVVGSLLEVAVNHHSEVGHEVVHEVVHDGHDLNVGALVDSFQVVDLRGDDHLVGEDSNGPGKSVVGCCLRSGGSHNLGSEVGLGMVLVRAKDTRSVDYHLDQP